MFTGERPAVDAATDGGNLLSPSTGLTKVAEISAINAAAAPERSHNSRHSAPYGDAAATTAADTKMPTPTPAKWIDAYAFRSDNDNRASTKVDAHTITKALDKPPMKRAAIMAMSFGKRPVAAVDTTLSVSPANNHRRGDNANIRMPAARAPIR